MRRTWLVSFAFGVTAVWFLATGGAALTLGEWQPGLWGVAVAGAAFYMHRFYWTQWNALRRDHAEAIGASAPAGGGRADG